ncbi:uncharacterized protein LOC144648419 [Oculina patagonica]
MFVVTQGAIPLATVQNMVPTTWWNSAAKKYLLLSLFRHSGVKKHMRVNEEQIDHKRRRTGRRTMPHMPRERRRGHAMLRSYNPRGLPCGQCMDWAACSVPLYHAHRAGSYYEDVGYLSRREGTPRSGLEKHYFKAARHQKNGEHCHGGGSQ